MQRRPHTNGTCLSRHIEISASLKSDHHVRQVAVAGTELVIEEASSSSRWISVHPLFESRSIRPNRTLPIDVSSYKLLYVKKHKVYIASCEDLQIRVYCPNFTVLQGVPMPSSALCLLYLEGSDELLAGGVGQLHTWALHPQQKNMLTKTTSFTTTIKPQQWVVALALAQDGKTVLAVTHEGVHLLNLQMRTQANFIPNGHKSAISCALSYLDFIITAGRDGSIKLWSPSIAQVLGELSGHSHEVVGMAVHPTKPQLLSASQDGSIKVWGLDTLTELCQILIPEESLSSFALVDPHHAICYSQKAVTMLNICMPDSHLTALNSKVTSLKLSGSPGRLMAMCEDGGVRLVCPNSGEVISLVFPAFANTEHTFVDMVYCREHNAAIALLKSSEVMVFDAQVNPCCCAGLCSPDHNDNGVTCIAAGCLCVEEDELEVEVVFAGHLSGFISLLSGGSITMATCPPAHKGAVTTLTISPTHHHLLSFGADKAVRLWQLSLHYGSLYMTSLLHITLGGDINVQHAALTHCVMCVAFTNATLRTYQLPTSDCSRVKEEETTLGDLPTFSHSRTEDHTRGVLSLKSAPDIPVFCSAGLDNLVKLWTLDCLLLREVHLGVGLGGACLVPHSHNLVVALDEHLWMVEGPLWIGEVEEFTVIHSGAENVQNIPKKSIRESPIAFDPSVDFWYDPSRSTRQSIGPNTVPQTLVMPSRQLKDVLHNQVSNGSAKLASKVSNILNGEPMTSSDLLPKSSPGKTNYQSSTLRGPQAAASGTLESKLPQPLSCSLSSTHSKDEIIAYTASGSLRCQSPDTQEVLDSLTALRQQPPLILDRRVDLPKPSRPTPHFIIAPDGFIPNSVIRDKLGIKFDPGQFAVEVSSLELSFALQSLLQHKPQKDQNKVKSDMGCRSLSVQSTAIPVSAQSSTLEIALTEEDSTLSSAGGASKESTTWNDSQEDGSGTPGATGNLTQDKKQNASKAFRQRMKVDLEEIDFDFSMGRRGNRKSPVPRRRKANRIPRLSRPSQDDSDSCLSDSISSRPSTPVSTTGRLSCCRSNSCHSHTSVSRPATRQSMAGLAPGPRTSCGKTGSSDGPIPTTKALSFRSQNGTVDRGASSQHMNMLQRIVSEQWYPAECRQRVPTAKSVMKTLTGMLQSARDSVLPEVCTAVTKLHNSSMIAASQYDQIERVASEVLKASSAAAQASLLELITNLGLRSQRLLQSILPLLTSKDASVRRSSFAAIHQLAGVSNKAGLVKLMADMGLIQESAVHNEVNCMKGVAGRLQKKPVESFQSVRPSTSHQNGLMPKVDGSKRVSFTLIAVPPEEDCCINLNSSSPKHGDDDSKFGSGDIASSSSQGHDGEIPLANEPPNETEVGIEYSTVSDDHSHHRKLTQPTYNPSVEMLQRMVASELTAQDSDHEWTRQKINPTLLQRSFISNPSQMPMEAINLLYGQSLKKGKRNAMHKKFSWCNVHPVVTDYTAKTSADYPIHLPKLGRQKQAAN